VAKVVCFKFAEGHIPAYVFVGPHKHLAAEEVCLDDARTGSKPPSREVVFQVTRETYDHDWFL
jgi:hypothetical protein